MAILVYDSNFPSDLVPPAQEQFYWKVFLYFRPLEDDLDLDEEVEEERR